MPQKANRISLFVILTAAVAALAACGGGGGGSSFADSPTDARTANVRNGVVDVALDDETNGSVSDSRVGLVAYASGIDDRAGQIVAVAGIEGTPNVGAEVRSGTVRYNTRYNYALVDSVSRSSTFISGRTQTLARDGTTVLVADFGAGTLNSEGGAISVDGQINGQNVSGTAAVIYPVSSLNNAVRARIDTDLNGQIGADGVIATFTGSDSNTVVAGGLVGTAN